MRPVLILVEGEADKRFVSQYIEFEFNIHLDDNDIIVTKGWTNLVGSTKSAIPFINKMQQCCDEDGVNIIIFDADENVEVRRREIIEWGKNVSVPFELFLMPNNIDSGALEHLLECVINPKNQPVFDCWQHYEDELKEVRIEGRDEPLTIPAKKTKIYGYLEALLGKSKTQKDMIKEINRNYLNREHWDLESSYLLPLRAFLERCLKE